MGLTASFNRRIQTSQPNTTISNRSQLLFQCGLLTGLGILLGYQYGYRWCDQTDYTPYYSDYQSQEQIIHLIQQSNIPVYLWVYAPGHYYAVYQRYQFIKQAKKYHTQCHFIKANISQTPDVLKNRQINNIPYSALILPNQGPDQHTKPFIEIQSTKDYSQLGIQAFLEENTVIKRFQYKDNYNHQNRSLATKILDAENE